MQTVEKKMADGTLWMVLFKLTDRGIGIVSMVIMARLLTPIDYGIFSMAFSIVALLTLLSSFSFDIMLIQRQNACRELYDTAWTFNVLFGIGLAILLLILAQPASVFYDEPRLEWVIRFLAVSRLISGFVNIGLVDFRKNLNFQKEFVVMITSRLMGFVITVAAAFYLRSYWALVWGVLFGGAGTLVISYAMHPYRPRICLSSARDLFSFSGWLFAANMIYFLNGRAPDFIIGKLVGAQGLGFYNLASEIASLPTNELVQPINRVSYPGYAKLAKDDAALANAFLKVQSIITLIVLPISAGLIATADLFIPILLGQKWIDTVPLIQLLAIYGMLMAIQSNASTVYLAKGKPRVQTYMAGTYALLMLPSMFFLTSYYGLIGSVYAIITAVVVVTPISLWLSHRLLGINVSLFMKYIWRPVLSSGIMLTTVFWLKHHIYITPWLELIMIIIAGAMLYISLLLMLWWLSGKQNGAESFLIGYVQSKINEINFKEKIE